jgi:type IV pilus assembly protein PilW
MRNSRFPKRKAKGRAAGFSEAGFTLVEMMAAFVILFIAMSAAYATFEFQHASFTVQNRVAETQQNLRSALEVLGRDIMLAGYGIPAAVNLPPGLLPSGDNTIRTIDPLNSTTAADQIVLLYTYDMDANLPPTTLSTGMGAYTDTIRVASTNGFAIGDYIIVSNGTSADLFQITAAITDNTTLPHNALGVNAAASHAAFPGYLAGATVSKARFVRYFIDTITDPVHPTLMLDKMVAGVQPQPLADDIEDMQFQYGLDTNGDFIVDTTAVNAPTASQIPQIRQIRVMLSARARMSDRKWGDVRPAMGDRAAGAADNYRRRTIDVAIDLRNP